MSKNNNSTTESSCEDQSEKECKDLPTLYSIDTKGRVWQCWVIGNTIYRKYGLVDGKKIESERSFEGKSLGKKNETTGEEQAWAEANKEWVKHIDKEYLPKDDDDKGKELLLKINAEKKKSGGHNVNSVAASGGRATKTISRQKSDTCMVDNIIGGPVIPMKAEVWQLEDETDPLSVLPKVSKYFLNTTGRGKTLKTSPTDFYIQPKLDGWRARIMVQNKTPDEKIFTPEIVITSNSGKQYPWFSSLRIIVLEWLSIIIKNGDLVELLDGLDGEMYSNKFVGEYGIEMDQLTRFSTVCSICGLSRSSPHELEDQIQFHCFDLIDKSGTISQTDRFVRLDHLFKKLPKSAKNRIIRVETKILSDIKDIPEIHDAYANLGYEGVVLRTFEMKYKCAKRTPEMRKVKYFKDEEYEIHGCKVDKGVSQEQFVWILKTEDGKTFSAKPLGTKEQKLQWYKNRNTYIGSFLTIKFQDYSEDGVPRFPIAKHFRAAKGTD